VKAESKSLLLGVEGILQTVAGLRSCVACVEEKAAVAIGDKGRKLSATRESSYCGQPVAP